MISEIETSNPMTVNCGGNFAKPRSSRSGYTHAQREKENQQYVPSVTCSKLISRRYAGVGDQIHFNFQIWGTSLPHHATPDPITGLSDATEILCASGGEISITSDSIFEEFTVHAETGSHWRKTGFIRQQRVVKHCAIRWSLQFLQQVGRHYVDARHRKEI